MITTLNKSGQRCPRCRGTGRIVTDDVLGRMMRVKRERAALTQKAVAIQMKLSPGYLCDLELGRRHWTDVVLQSYEDALTVLAAAAKGTQQ